MFYCRWDVNNVNGTLQKIYRLLLKEVLLNFLKITQELLRKVSLFVVFLVCIFPYSDWILRDTSYLSVFSPNTENTEQKNSEYGHFLRIESSCFTTLLNAFFIWSLTSSFESRSIPKCFSIPNWLTLAPLHVKEGWFWLLKLTSKSNFFCLFIDIRVETHFPLESADANFLSHHLN